VYFSPGSGNCVVDPATIGLGGVVKSLNLDGLWTKTLLLKAPLFLENGGNIFGGTIRQEAASINVDGGTLTWAGGTINGSTTLSTISIGSQASAVFGRYGQTDTLLLGDNINNAGKLSVGA
jgi:hypothetical protein